MLHFYLSMLNTEEEKSEFERLYTTYRTRMYHVAMKYLNNSADAEDAVQEAFLRIADKRADIFKVGEEFKQKYIFTLVRHIAHDMFNAKTGRREVEYDDTLDSESDDSIPLEEIILGEIGYDELVAYINTMPTAMRDAMNLKYIIGIPNDELSRALGITENALRQRLFAARKLLKNYVDARNEEIASRHPVTSAP